MNARKPLNRKLSFWIGILIAVLVLAFLIRYQHQRNLNNQRGAEQSVVTVTAKKANVPVFLPALGSVTPVSTVTVRTQINGRLMEVYFKEGQTVKAGELLALIDPRPYKAQLMQYEGQLARDKALLENANVDLNRYKKLWSQDSIAKQTYDTQLALVHQYEGAIKVDEGLIEATKLNILYCRIVSPVNGRIGLRLVDAGNYVQTSDTNGIAVVNTLQPITVIFTLAEDNIPQVLEQINAGRILKVLAYDRSQSNLLAEGSLITIDNQIDTNTGTVRLKALFENKDNKLFPSQFVNVQLLIKTLQNTTVIPTPAIQYGANGPYVYVISIDKVAHVKNVVTSVAINEDTAILSGIEQGQVVVVEGADKLTEGSPVKIANAETVNTRKDLHSGHKKPVT